VTALPELVDEGRAGLDGPVGRCVAGVPNADRITLRELAGMRSALFDHAQDPGFFTALTSGPRRSFTPRQLLAHAFEHPALFPPGRKFSCCSTSLVLLGLVVGKAGGKPALDHIHDSVLAPAGLRHTPSSRPAPPSPARTRRAAPAGPRPGRPRTRRAGTRPGPGRPAR
jgi:D-alanyl-D-alanine carboxypeptidase